MKNIRAIECINTLQGEGRDAGQRMLLIRFKYCNRRCIFCDTSVKMRISLESEYKIDDIQKIIDEEKTNLLITGGEPTHLKHFHETLSLLNNLNYSIANVESNGYRLPELISEVDTSKNGHYMYSPKIFNEEDLKEELNRTTLLLSNKNVFIKIVYQDTEYVRYYLEVLSKTNINNRVFLMPEGTTRDAIIANSPEVFDACEKYKFNFSSRSHIIYSFI
jgi:7-carboxy-7-deazaguanine synthase